MTVPKRDRADPVRPVTPWLLRRANRRYRQAIRAALADDGFDDLPPEGWWAVDALAHGAQDATALVGMMGTSRQAASKLVEALVGAAYVRRETDERDRRRVRLVLTDRGREAERCLATTAAATDADLADELGAEDFALLRSVLLRLEGPALPGQDSDAD